MYVVINNNNKEKKDGIFSKTVENRRKIVKRQLGNLLTSISENNFQ